MSLFDLQDVCIAIGSLATLDLPMIVDLIGIYGLKGPYCTLTTTNWFLQALSVIPRGSWGDVARRFTMIRWAMDRSDLIVDRNYDETTVMQMNRMFIRWTGPAPGPMGRFKPITPIHSLEPRVAQHKYHNLKALASTQKSASPLPQPHARPPPTAAPPPSFSSLIGGRSNPVVDLIRRNVPPPTVNIQSPCDSGWSQVPVASKGKGRLGKQVSEETAAQNREDDIVQPIIPECRRARQVEVEVEHLTQQADEMELVMARFQ
ncbi:hypothetical protein F511_18864 [Dorcoceras hygrometricum]|uniref:Uncharacterized protein n=1 Tax=Dorcoceras hygrometricum TaxID=472368 RepID=A0A2Z7A7Z7_9LAMI|nr:hypothetical protein F511_18864 [Dorcoceras hygrometricum]